MVTFIDRPIVERLALIFAAASALLVTLTAIPGYFSHDELVWLDRIRSDNSGWGLGLANLYHSPFFRPLGALAISSALRLPLQPFAAHIASVFLQSLNCCLLYLLVSRLWPNRALAAALFFAVMPGTAFAVGWVAASFDLLFVFFALASLAAAINFWRGQHWVWGGLAGMAFCAGLLCKETALAIPLAAAIVLHCESARANPRRIALLATAAVAVVTIYGFLRFPMLLRMGTGAGGSDPASAGYEFAAIGAIATNGLAYFGFPFAVKMAEITGFENQSLSAILACTAAHLLIIFILWHRYGKPAPLFYVTGYFLPLLPVLIISKYETQYIYASSIALSVAIALIWTSRLFYAIPTLVLGTILALHGFRIQHSMYTTGACQTRALQTTGAVLPFVRALGPAIVYGADNTPWWVLARALTEHTFQVDDRNISVVLSHRVEGASLNFSANCAVTPIGRLVQ